MITLPRRSAQKSVRPEPIIPMINVVFLLLIFFLISAAITPPPPVEIRLPQLHTSEGNARQEMGSADVYFTRAADTLFEGQANAAALSALLERLQKAEGTPVITLHADAALEAAEFVALFQALRDAVQGARAEPLRFELSVRRE